MGTTLLNRYQSDPNVQIVTGVCPHDCPDSCSWQVAVDRATGRALDIWGHPDHPVTAGALCTKVDRYLERTYHRGRLTTPLKRTGAKGEGRFTPVSWDEAIGGIAARLQEIIARYGAESVLPYSYAGTMGLLQGEGMAQRFFNRMGASQLARTICSVAGGEGYAYTIGATEGMETEAFARAKLILIWGSNTLTSNMHLWPFVQQAKNDGARVVVIDPARTRTARAAGEWFPLRPGTDAALALAMMHVIIGEDLIDADYVARYTLGFDALAARTAEWTPERAAEITGAPAERIRELARAYATTRPAAIRVNYGLQRHAGGGMAARTVACLPALVGAWRDHGGGIQLSASGAFRHMDRTTLHRSDLLTGEPRTLNMIRLGDALSLDPDAIARAHHHPRPVDAETRPEDAGPPVKALIVYNSNPAAVNPDQSAVLDGLRRDDLFAVVLEHFQTDTADYADYVLPATTQLEHWDIIKPYGHLHLALNRPAIAPVGQSLPNSEIFRRLAAAMSYAEPCFAQSDEEVLRQLVESQTHPTFSGITWDALLDKGFMRLKLPQPYLPFAQGGFPTPSGKCEFYSERMAQDGYDPLPAYTPPAWQQAGEPPIDTDAPLVCISPPAHSFLNSSFVNVDRLRTREGQPLLRIHPADAAARAITEAATVRVWNERGEVRLVAALDDGLAPGTVLAPGVWWAKFSPDGRNVNQLTPQQQSDMGGGASFYDVRVQVEPVAPPAEQEDASPAAVAPAAMRGDD
jgi:anaerobic selenocysteine-containing dehydrogenase